MQDSVYNPFSENSKKMIHDMWNVKFIKLCETSSKVQCSCCLSYWTNCIVCCTCGNYLCHTDSTRKLNRDRFDTLSISNCVIKKGSPHGSRHGKTEEQRLYHTAQNAWKRCRKKKDSTGQEYTGILHRLLKNPRCRESKEAHGWTEERCAEYDALAQEDHSYTLTTAEYLRHASHWKIQLNSSGRNGPMAKRSDYQKAVRLKN